MPPIVTLQPPLFSEQYIDQRISCIRAHRERIFRTETEYVGQQLICHNYGQGGAGFTFLFGCVTTSLEQFEAQLAHNFALRRQPITVVGAGIYGLLTAATLATKGYTVRIVAEEPNKRLPSDTAAGFFFPRPRKSSTPAERATFTACALTSYRTYLAIIRNEHPFLRDGATLLPAYYGAAIEPGFAPLIAQQLIPEPRNVTIDFGTGKQYPAFEYQTIFIKTAALMQELRTLVMQLGIPQTQEKVTAWEQLPEKIIFNCTGLGARELIPESRIIPVQGHLITLKQQEPLPYLLNDQITVRSVRGHLKDELVYYAPKASGILGITFIRGEDSITANQHEFERLLERCRSYFGV